MELVVDVTDCFFFCVCVFLSMSSAVLLGGPFQCLVVSTSYNIVSFLCITFQIVVMALPNACAMALIESHLFLCFKMAMFFFFPRSTPWQSLQTKLRPQIKSRHLQLCIVQTVTLTCLPI